MLHLLAPAPMGGLERVVHMLATHQRDENVHVAAVIAPSYNGNHPFCRGLIAEGVAVVPIHAGARDYIGEYRRISQLVRELRPRVMHSHGYHADVLGAVVARRHGVAIVSTVHGFTGGGRRNRMYETLQCRALRHADAVIGVASSVVERLASAGVPEHRLHCIPNGYGSAGELALASRQEAREQLHLSSAERVVGWVGRVSSEKGLDVAIRAIHVAHPRWKLSVIGDGPERPAMMRLADSLGLGSRVHWHGPVSDAARVLRAFDAVLLSSRTEGTPIVLLEAMRAGIPIIATAVGGVPDMLGDREAVLVRSESPGEIARALEGLWKDPEAAWRRARAARARLEREFGMPRWLGAVRSVYESVAPLA